MFIMRDQVDVIHDEEQYMLQTPVKIDVKQEIKEENTTEEQQSDEQQMLQTPVKIEVKEEIKEEITAEEQQSDEDDDEQQMLQTPVKIEVKQQEIKEENTAEEQQSDEDDYSPSDLSNNQSSFNTDRVPAVRQTRQQKRRKPSPASTREEVLELPRDVLQLQKTKLQLEIEKLKKEKENQDLYNIILKNKLLQLQSEGKITITSIVE
ncbi:probable inactive protein kinase DDB_G0270444 isoform X2 [Xyrauchen texanus]|nr:probable inactive protein kinase DDB_G0270444 isoform X2 [Xyrauchen texanus]XP_051956056.1 probable inactive protein kinase DDB_G0270444 isoform X2 [Xyrauchen texanus]XP_051956057.1 probable inactive protein kinase DDB_G0270444 isoform X2 [Xyrauchen texanus]